MGIEDKNIKLLEEMKNYVPEGYISPNAGMEIAVSRARGSVIYDLNNKKYIDLTSGVFTNSFGHCYAPLVLTSFMQSFRMSNVHGRRTEAELSFYKQLSGFMPSDDYRFIPYNDGGYAIDRALSDIINFFGKERVGIAAFKGGFHGKTMGTKLVINETEKAAFYDNFQVAFPNCYRCPKGYEKKCRNMDCINDIYAALEQKNAKAIIFEPVQGAGVLIPPDGFWAAMESFCKSKGILMFADEILTGGGRTGHFLASCGNYGITADIISLAKGLANGHPLSVLCEKKYITENQYAKRLWERSSTFAAHPQGLAIGTTVLKQLKSKNIFSHVRSLEVGFREALEALKEEYACVGDARCVGLMGAVEFVKSRDCKRPFPALSEKVLERCRGNGLEVILNGHIIRLAPPLNIKEKMLQTAMRLLRVSIKEALRDTYS